MEKVNDFQAQLKALEQTVADLCMADCSLDIFYRDFLDRVVRVLGKGGAIWVPVEGSEFQIYQPY